MKQTYRKKVEDVQAYKYSHALGSEDVTPLDRPIVYKNFSYVGMLKVNYVSYVRDGDYIVIDKNGKIHSYGEEIFFSRYDLVEDLIPHGNC